MLIVSLIAFSSVLMNLYTGIRVFKANPTAKPNRLFLLLCLSLCVWGIGYIFSINAETAQVANHWRAFSAFGWCLFFGVFLQFSIIFTNHQGWLRARPVQWVLYVPGVIFFLQAATVSPNNFVYTDFGWVYSYAREVIWQLFFAAYYTSYTVAGFYLIYMWGKRAVMTREKKQAQIIVRTMLVVYIVAAPFDTYLPLLGYPVLSIAILLSTVFISSIYYAITRYRLMTLNFKTAADSILNNMMAPVLLVGSDLMVREINATTTVITGYEAEALVGKHVSAIIKGNLQAMLDQENVLTNEWGKNSEVALVTSSQTMMPCLLSIKMFQDEFGEALGFILLLHDITDRKKYEELLQHSNDELEHKVQKRTLALKESNASLKKEIMERKTAEAQIQYYANYDALTGLPNRRYCYEQINRSIAKANGTSKLMVMFIDLDNFKYVNDTFGHAAGDLVLQQIVLRINRLLHSSDLLARLGGDEFLLIREESTRQDMHDGVILLANLICQVCSHPFRVNYSEAFISASIGIAFYPKDGMTADVLIKNADSAMYKAKNAGKNKYAFYSSSTRKKVKEHDRLKLSLLRVIDNEELLLHYQPQVDSLTGKITGVEALARWRSADNVWVSPSEFIPLAEEMEMIVPIGQWVMQQAFSQLKKWHTMGFSDLRMTVNVSARQLQEENFSHQAVECLQQLGIETSHVEFEIIEDRESMNCNNDKNIIGMLETLKTHNINISMNAFGIGNSSLMSDTNFLADRLKIARPFVAGIGKKGNDAAIVSSIIKLAHEIGIKVTAEGVETKEELDYLRKEKCDEIQGYYFYKPMSPDKIEPLLYSLYK